MRFMKGIFTLAIVSVLLSVCDAFFDQQKAIELAKITRTTALLDGNPDNIAKFEQAVDLVRTKFPNCEPNVCFQLDGSGSINNTEWEYQKSFVALAVGTLGGLSGSKFAAVEYAAIATPITTLLPASAAMLIKIRDATRKKGFTFIGPAVQWCTTQVVLDPAAVNKMILLGDARSTFGKPYGPFGAVNLAKTFRALGPGYGTSAGLVDPRKEAHLDANLKLFGDIVGNPNLVFRQDDWAKIITVVVAFVELICNA